MDGLGSGNWHRWRTEDTVEDCPLLDVSKLRRDRLLWAYPAGTLSWRNGATGEVTSTASFDVKPVGGGMIFTLHYRFVQTDEKITLPICLQATYPGFGGRRGWFTCPLVMSARACNRRVLKLYLPRRGRYFGCRHYYDLT
jgi:hypothetical protein